VAFGIGVFGAAVGRIAVRGRVLGALGALGVADALGDPDDGGVTAATVSMGLGVGSTDGMAGGFRSAVGALRW
jgi:hypothetical protein